MVIIKALLNLKGLSPRVLFIHTKMNDTNNNKLQQQFSNFLKVLPRHLTSIEQFEWSKAVSNMKTPAEYPYSIPPLDFSKYGKYESYKLLNANGSEALKSDTGKPIIEHEQTF